MAKNWYPVIDYEKCTGCGACFNKCSHGVYKMEEGRPVVVYPLGCVDGCRGCQNLCPSSAIEYVGDKGGDGECCSCKCSCC